MLLDIKDISWPGWETVQLLGRGSFGGVYEIKRNVLGTEETAALKVISIPQSETEIDELLSEGMDNDSISRTFENQLHYIVNEYSMMRRLTGCSNIVHSDDVKYVAKEGGIGWDIFIKMELLTPLTKALPQEISDETVIRIGKDMCNALAHCHHYNIVHRDIKPQNMFLTDTGVCKLGDFGIAKTMERTMGGTRIGTFKYMAPEVYHGKPYGSRSDIYSLGLVLYWLLNQRRMPFVPLPPAQLLGGMDGDAANRRISGEPFPAPVGGSAELKQIVMKACAFDPNDRFQTAEEMGIALENIGRQPIIPPAPIRQPVQEAQTVRVTPTPAQPARPPVQQQKKSGKGWLIAIIVLLLAAVIGLTAVLLLKEPEDTDERTDRKEIFESQETQEPEETPTSPEDDPPSPTETESVQESKAKVPDVTGVSMKEAQAILEDAGFEGLIISEPIYDDTAAPGTVIRQSVEEGTAISPDMSITLYISAGAAPSATEPPEETQPAISDTQNNKLVAASSAIAAVKADGTALVSSGLYGSTNGWKNVVSVAIGSDHTVALCKDGTVKTYGMRGGAHCVDARQWTNIVAIDAASNFTVGLTKDGTVLTAGENTFGRCDVSSWSDIVAIAACDIATVGLKKDGTIVIASSYNYGDTSYWSDIVAVDICGSHVVGLKKDGTVVASSLFNTNGECNVGDWEDIIAISAGTNHTVGLKKDGTVVAAGKDGNEALNVTSWTDIVAIAAGYDITAGIKKDGTLVLAGKSSLFSEDAQAWTGLATE